jgi:hypothetical protein
MSEEHEITVATLRELLTQLEPEDVLIPNVVGNLKIVRGGTYIGYVDLLKDLASIDVFVEDVS